MKKKLSFIRLIQAWAILLLMGLGTSFVVIDLIGSYRDFNSQTDQIRRDYIDRHKQIIRREVVRVVDMIRYEKQESQSDARNIIQSRVYEAWAVAQHIYLQNKDARPMAETQKMIVDALRPIRFENGSGYYFITRLDGVDILFADRPQMEGLNLLEMRDSRGQYVVKDMIQIANHPGEGYYEYHWTKPGKTGNDFKKISFIKRFEPYEWYIGTGLYVEDAEKAAEAELLSDISRIRFGKEGYVFVNRFNGEALVSNGRVFSGSQKLWEVFGDDPEKMKSIFEKELDAALKSEGDYIYYSHIKLTDDSEETQKISYISGMPELQWLVGAGIYLDEVENDIALMQDELNRKVQIKIFFFMLISSVVFAGFFLFFSRLNRRLKSDIDHFVSFFKRAAHSAEEIDRKSIRFLELEQMGEYANKMLRDRKQAEKILKESETRYRLHFENVSDIIYVVDTEFKLVDISPSVERVLGYSPKELIGRPFQELNVLQPGYLEQAFSEAMRIFKGERIASSVYQFIARDGSKKWGEISGAPLFRDNQVMSLISVARDITERKEMEDALVVSERKWRDILVNVPQIGISLNPEGKIVFANAHFQKMSGWKEEEILGQDWFEMVIPEELRNDIRGVFNTVMTQKDIRGLSTYENDIVINGGERRHIAWSNVITKGARGEILDVTCLGVDLTERQAAEKLLSESEAKYRSMMESLNDPVHICSSDLILQYMNPAMIRRVGRDATGEPCYRAIHDLHAKCEWCNFNSVSKGNSVEISIISPKDGRHYRVNSMPIYNKDGSVSKLSIFRDMTEYMRAVSEKEKITAQLHQAQKLESIGTLAGGIAHDFNNILSSIIGYTELALEDVKKGTLLESHLREVFAASKRAADLVKQILAFARRSDETIKPLHAGTMVKEVLKLMRSTIPTTIDIRQHLDSESVIMGNPSQVHQLFMNLCTNAAQAMEDSGGVLEVCLSDVEINKTSPQSQLRLKPGDYLKATVSDTGSGIAPDIIDSIFEPYFTTKATGEGTGLGLSMVHGIVEVYGGKITVESELGKGTKFTIYLPITKKRENPRPFAQQYLPPGSERILFVDDEYSIARVGGLLLEGLGYAVTVMTVSTEALDRFRAAPGDFDLVVTDMTMPEMTGDRLAAELMKIRPDIPVILCTGYSRKISDETASKLGIRAFVYKPIDREHLAKTVRNVLDRR